MKTFAATRALLLALGLLGSSACKKSDPGADGLTYVGGLPYYHFTDDDRRWLKARQGDVWKFENARGYQRAYQVSQATESIKVENWYSTNGIPSSSTLLGYNDYATMRFGRVDSVNRSGAELRFARGAAMRTTLSSGGHDKQTSQFYVRGEDSEFVGNTDVISDYYSCRGLKFPRAAALNGPFMALTVRGRQYTDVVVLTGTSRGATCASVPSSFMQELYYDRQAGLVRMVSLTGEVWDRVP